MQDYMQFFSNLGEMFPSKLITRTEPAWVGFLGGHIAVMMKLGFLLSLLLLRLVGTDCEWQVTKQDTKQQEVRTIIP